MKTYRPEGTKECAACEGTGVARVVLTEARCGIPPTSKRAVCGQCDGKGWVSEKRAVKRPCPECGAQPLRLHAPGCVRDRETFDEELEGVDGSDVDRVVAELVARGGADAALGRFLRDRVAEHYADIDPESCVGDE